MLGGLLCQSDSSSPVLLAFYPETNGYYLLGASQLAGSCILPCKMVRKRREKSTTLKGPALLIKH